MGYIQDKIAELEAHDKIILNAFLIAGIAFMSSINPTAPISWDMLRPAIYAFGMALFVQLKALTSDTPPPKFGMLI